MQCNIAIIGAGIAGAATAYHLRRLGADDVVLLEKEHAPGTHSTARNAAICRQKVHQPAAQHLAEQGAATLRSGELCEFRRVGGVLIGHGCDDASQYFPTAKGQGAFCPDDGVVDPAGLLHTYLRGQRVLCNTTVEGWHTNGDSRVTIRTNSGEISARIVVNAAGPWAGQLGGLPLEPRNRHLYITPPMRSIDPGWPYVWDDNAGLYFRPESGGLLLCPCDEEARTPGDYRVDHDVQHRLADVLARTQPQLADVAIKQCWTGQRTFAPDRNFVIGWDPRSAAAFHVCALGGHGITTSYAVGQLAAELIVNPDAHPDNPFDPARLIEPAIKVNQ